jgi:hypothetical protein
MGRHSKTSTVVRASTTVQLVVTVALVAAVIALLQAALAHLPNAVSFGGLGVIA